MAWWHGADSTGHSYGPDHPDIVSDLVEPLQSVGCSFPPVVADDIAGAIQACQELATFAMRVPTALRW